MDNLLLVCGEDTFLTQRRARELAEATVPPEARATGLEIIEAASGNADDVAQALWRALEAVQTLGFFGAGKLVWLRGVDPLFAARTQQPRAVAEAADTLLARLNATLLPDEHTLLIQVGAVNRGGALFKAFVKHAKVHDFKVGSRPFEQEQHAREQLDQLLREHRLQMTAELRGLFIARVGAETWRLHSELEKLDLYLAPERKVTREAIVEATSLGSLESAWDLTDAFGARDLTGALKALHRLIAQRQNPIGLATMLETRMRDLLVYREAIDRGWLRAAPTERAGRPTPPRWAALPESAEAAFGAMCTDPRKANPYFAARLAAQAQAYTLRELRNARHVLITARERMVSTGITPETLLELALTRSMAKRTATRRRRAS